jgi:hypothetical protein
MLLETEIVFYCENETKHKKTLGGESEGFWNVKTSGVQCRHFALKGKYAESKRQRQRHKVH